MVGVEVACKDSFEVAFVEDSHMVKALAADGPDEALDIGRLPRGVWCNQDLLDAEAVHSGPEWSAVYAIAVSEALAYGLRRLRDLRPLRPLRHLGHTPALYTYRLPAFAFAHGRQRMCFERGGIPGLSQWTLTSLS
jgi:hypothetical protein